MMTTSATTTDRNATVSVRHIERGNFKLKFLDRYVGIAVIWMLRWFKYTKRPRPMHPTSIGILTNAAIGDTVIMSAAFQDIRSTYPDANVVVFATRSNLEVCRMLFDSGQVVLLDVLNPFEAIRVVRRHRFDVFIDMGQWTRLNALISFFSHSKHTMGFRTEGQHKHYLYDHAVDHLSNVHEIVNFKNLASAMGAVGEHLPNLTVDSPSNRAHSRLVVVHVAAGGTRSYLKQWPAGHWAVVVDYLLGKGYQVAFSGSSSDLPEIDEVVKSCRRTDEISIYAGSSTLSESATLLDRSFLVISVDTGIMHLAAALKCNLVSLHGPSPARRWGPLNSNSIALQSPYEKAPCLNLGFEFKCGNKRCPCMSLIAPSEVIEAIGHFERKGLVPPSTTAG